MEAWEGERSCADCSVRSDSPHDSQDDAKVLHNAAPLILPVVMEIVDGESSVPEKQKANRGADYRLPQGCTTTCSNGGACTPPLFFSPKSGGGADLFRMERSCTKEVFLKRNLGYE